MCAIRIEQVSVRDRERVRECGASMLYSLLFSHSRYFVSASL
jgi:hypothetical protein